MRCFGMILIPILIAASMLIFRSTAWSQNDQMEDMPGMQHQQSIMNDPAMQTRLLSEKRESEFNHHLSGFLLILAGALIFSQDRLAKPFPQIKYAWPICFLIAGMFVLVFSDTELWPFGEQNWVQAMSTDHEVLQHKLFAAILLVIGIIEALRVGGILNGKWAAWIFPVAAFLGTILLLFHSHEAGMHGPNPMALMERIQWQHRWYAILGFAIATNRALAETFKRRLVFMTIWPGLVMVLGISLMFYTE